MIYLVIWVIQGIAVIGAEDLNDIGAAYAIEIYDAGQVVKKETE